MSLIQFTGKYDDLSTDRGYQFKFYCDKCGNGKMTHFETSVLGMAQSVLNAAGNVRTGIDYRYGSAEGHLGQGARRGARGGCRGSQTVFPAVYQVRAVGLQRSLLERSG